MSTLLNLSVASALALAPALAYAEPPPDPKSNPTTEDLDRAKELFENGKTLFSEGSYTSAIAAFKRAYSFSGDPNLLYNIALAYDRDNKFDEALEYLEYYRAVAPEEERAGLAAREESLRKRQLRAQTEAASEDANRGSGDKSGDGSGSGDGGAVPDARGGSGAEGDTGPSDNKPLITTPVWALGAVSLVAIGVGTGLGITALNRTSDAEDRCITGICTEEARDLGQSGRRMAIGADVVFGVAAVAGIVAIAIVASNAAKRKKRAGASASIVPVRRGAGLSVRF